MTLRELAEKYGCSISTAHRILQPHEDRFHELPLAEQIRRRTHAGSAS